MRLYNIDVEESDRKADLQTEEPELEDRGDGETCRSFFELRQRTLTGMDQLSAIRIVALGLVRKLHASTRGAVLYAEVEDALNRYLRLLDVDMQRFASLHETLRDAAEKHGGVMPRNSFTGGGDANSPAIVLFREGMEEIAVVLLACDKMQRRALDLKLGAQRSISEGAQRSTVSFARLAEFLEDALAVCDQLRRKHEELQALRIRAMASAAEARAAMKA